MKKHALSGIGTGDSGPKRDVGSHRVTVTMFPDQYAKKCRKRRMNLSALCKLILSTTAPAKNKLPWLKFAIFGNARNASRSLRHNANVAHITGVEMDYDGEQIPFNEAVNVLKKFKLQAIIYTSPSHTEEKPRWRILLPTSTALPPSEREKLAARINGVFDGVFAGESFTLSQAYYYGRVGLNPAHRAEFFDGDFIDLRDDLDATARYKNGDKSNEQHRSGEPTAEPAVIAAALAVIANDNLEWEEWNRLGMATWRATNGSEEGRTAFHKFSEKSSKYNKAATDERWDHYFKSPPTELGAGTIFHLANKACPNWRSNYEQVNAILDRADPMNSARQIAIRNYTDQNGRRVLHRYRGTFWRWTGSHYQIVDDETLRSDIWQYLETAQIRRNGGALGSFKPTRARVSDIFEALSAICQLDKHIEPPAWLNGCAMPSAKEFFAVGNGLLHLPTQTLYPPTPDYFGISASEVTFDKKASKPTQWLTFLDQVLGDRDSIAALQEWMGYTLAPDTSQQKILLEIGPRRSGKGTSARIQTKLLGRDSVAGPTMSSLGENFGLEPLITTPLAIIADARIGGRTDKSALTERLLSISGEDTMTVPRKFKSAWSGRLPVRFQIMTNELPSLNEGSGALAGRFIVIAFKQSFYGKEDHGLTGRLLTELPGILNWAILGYQRLRKRGHFVQPKNAQEQIDAIEMLGSPVKAFVRDKCVVKTGQSVAIDALYNSYVGWCNEQGHMQPGTKEWFGRNLRSAVPGLQVTKRGKAKVRTYEGIGLVPLANPFVAFSSRTH